MILDPETRQAVIERTAELLAEEVKREMGGLDSCILIELGTAAQCLGVTRNYVASIMPVQKLSARSRGVRLSDLKRQTANR